VSQSTLFLSNFNQVDFTNANLSYAQSPIDAMHGWGSNFYQANFHYTNLNHAQLYGDFRHTNFTHAALQNSKLAMTIAYAAESGQPCQSNANCWAKVDFSDANLKGATLTTVITDNQPADLSQSIFCKTIMPNGRVNNRDCP